MSDSRAAHLLDERTERELRVLEAKAEESSDPARAAPCYNAAGDICHEGGRIDRAVRYYGMAIDAYLTAGMYVAGRVVSRKLIAFSPDAVRARCTLAWLSLGRGMVTTAKKELTDYVAAAGKAGQLDLAIRHLRLMSEVVTEPELLRFIGARLHELGDEPGSRAAQTLAESAPPGAPAPASEDRWERVLKAALAPPGDLLSGSSSSPA